MAVDKVTKVLVAVHQQSRDSFLGKLQRLGLMHVTGVGAEVERSAGSDGRRVIEAVETLTGQVSRKRKELKAKPTVTREQFEATLQTYDHTHSLEQLGRLQKEQLEIENRLKAIEAERRRLGGWAALKHAPDELYGLAGATVTLGRFANVQDFQAAGEALGGRRAELEQVAEEGGEVLAMLVSAPDIAEDTGRAVAEHRFEVVDLRNVPGRPADVLAALTAEAAQIRDRQAALSGEFEALASELPSLKTTADALAAQDARQAAAGTLQKTESVSLVYGWVKTRDLPKVKASVEETGVAALIEVAPGEGEEPPVALVNRPVFRPFEMVLELFSMPSPHELDPTWLVAPFFSLFFALCLTDAGYAIVLAVVVYFMMRKMGTGNKLLAMILVGAILTVPAGALVGGWFGDIPDRLGIDWLVAIKNRFMWFDPIKDPMKFFIISIAVGYVQLIVGIAFEIFDCLRVRNYGDGLLGQLPWFVFLNALVARVTLARSLPVWAASGLVVLVLASVAAIVVFTQRSRETRLSQTLWFALIAAFLVYFGARVRWLPPELLAIKWAFVGLFAAMFLWAALSVVRSRSFKPVPVVLAVLGLAGVALYFARVLPPLLAFLPGLLFMMLSPASRSVGAKLGWGAYALYGATSYIGVVLSYIRLMALGMCTGGVAVAINVIAWMLVPIPVVGVLLAVLALIGGHTYNIAVSVLGAFVHSLRLQYVEFFPRFYTGGGERFEPFRERTEFVTIKQ